MSGGLGETGDRKARPLILHVSGDFPDPIERFKTPVIRQLIELSDQAFDHYVISINRVSPSPGGFVRSVLGGDALSKQEREFTHGTALTYAAPGKGVRHRTKLEQLGRFIAEHVEAMERRPDLIVGHKLTIEGLAVAEASRLTGLPYALSIQGNTDIKIMRSRPDLLGAFREIYHGARVVFPFAPWAQAQVEAKLGERKGPTILLPCPTELDEPQISSPDGNGLISVFHLKNYAGKNLAGLVAAYRRMQAKGEDLPPLEIIGGGTAEEMAACKALAADFPQITFTGPMGRAELSERMNRASAFVMPSKRESFGLVFIEALFAGIPIIHPRGSSVDGYFDEESFALGVYAKDPDDIADAIRRAIENEAKFKREIAAWQRSDRAKRFTRAAIADAFESGLKTALRGP